MIEIMDTPLWRMRRLGIVMEPDLSDPHEAGGVLNPAAARGPDGHLYLLPRLVAAGNFSRIGLARVVFDRHGNPVTVERMGVVLEPQAPYEINPTTGGGVEDPRITYIAARGLYVMTYTAFGPDGPRIAAAVSRDLAHWRRLGLVRFAPHQSIDLASQDNKDALLFPEPVPAPDGRPALALIHRPSFRAVPSQRVRPLRLPPDSVTERPSMWISYAPLDEIVVRKHVVFGQHHLLIGPQPGWEGLKVGGGAPPVRLGDCWLVLYHGVSGHIDQAAGGQRRRRYCAGALLLDGRDPRCVLYRSARSLLAPRAVAEREGVVPRVVFPTGLDARPDGCLDVYYGMADSRIGVARACLTGLAMPARAA
jgi:predicted GH43/DUF377 family glycosyl hydrolase